MDLHRFEGRVRGDDEEVWLTWKFFLFPTGAGGAPAIVALYYYFLSEKLGPEGRAAGRRWALVGKGGIRSFCQLPSVPITPKTRAPQSVSGA